MPRTRRSAAWRGHVTLTLFTSCKLVRRRIRFYTRRTIRVSPETRGEPTSALASVLGVGDRGAAQCGSHSNVHLLVRGASDCSPCARHTCEMENRERHSVNVEDASAHGMNPAAGRHWLFVGPKSLPPPGD
jgi:hypothetical protein